MAGVQHGAKTLESIQPEHHVVQEQCKTYGRSITLCNSNAKHTAGALSGAKAMENIRPETHVVKKHCNTLGRSIRFWKSIAKQSNT